MRLIREIGPLAVVTVAVLAVTTWMLGDDPSLGRWLLAAILFAHGWVHLMFVFPRPAPKPGAGDQAGPTWPFDLRSSWLVTRAGVGVAGVAAIGRLLVLVVFAVSLLAALATIGVLVPAALWAGLVVAAAAGSLAVLGIWFTWTLVIGVTIDLWLAWIALAGPWSPGA